MSTQILWLHPAPAYGRNRTSLELRVCVDVQVAAATTPVTVISSSTSRRTRTPETIALRRRRPRKTRRLGHQNPSSVQGPLEHAGGHCLYRDEWRQRRDMLERNWQGEVSTCVIIIIICIITSIGNSFEASRSSAALLLVNVCLSAHVEITSLAASATVCSI